jgi:hypothetical protein
LIGCGDRSDPAVIEEPQATATPTPALSNSVFTALELPDSVNKHRAYCSLDGIGKQKAVGQTVNVEAGSEVLFSGWVGDWSRRAPKQFTIVLRDTQTYAINAAAGGNRPDVAGALKSDAMKDSGFRVNARLGDVAPGNYEVSIVLKSGNQYFARCPTTTRLVVVPATG